MKTTFYSVSHFCGAETGAKSSWLMLLFQLAKADFIRWHSVGRWAPREGPRWLHSRQWGGLEGWVRLTLATAAPALMATG